MNESNVLVEGTTKLAPPSGSSNAIGYSVNTGLATPITSVTTATITTAPNARSSSPTTTTTTTTTTTATTSSNSHGVGFAGV